MLHSTVEAVDRDLAETTRRRERHRAQGNTELVELYTADIEALLDRRNDLTRRAHAFSAGP